LTDIYIYISLVHRGKNVTCLVCQSKFVTVAGLAQHYEMGGCKVKITRQQIRQAIDNWESKNNIQGYITKPMIEWHGSNVTDVYATERSFNGRGYECYLCHREFNRLMDLNRHLKSPAHEAKNYKCPKCNRSFNVISGLVQHFESESCGFVKFEKVNQIANDLSAQMSRLIMY
jgi:DNA-directed RNA polymerase subunit RPC12/RpoP